MSAHATYSPSSAHRWIHCPGSIPLVNSLAIKDEAGYFAAEGTVAHEIAAYCLTHPTTNAKDYVGESVDQDGHKIEVDTEMASYIQVYVDAIRRRVGAPIIETRLPLSDVLGVEDQFGTGDAVVFAPDALEVHDLKFGRGHKVHAERNEQMMLYGLGALAEYAMLGAWDKVRLTIHQPRLDHVSEWECSVEDLIHFSNQARQAVLVSQEPSAASDELNPGDKQCRWCPAKAVCPALQRHVAETCFDDLTDEVRPVPTTLHDISVARARVELVEAWAAAVVKATEDALMAGKQVPGWKVVLGRKGTRKWSDEAAAEEAMKSMRLKADEMYTKSLISPAKAEKLVTDKKWVKLAEHVTQADGKPQVVPESDSREAISRADSFDDLTK